MYFGPVLPLFLVLRGFSGFSEFMEVDDGGISLLG